MKKTGGYNSREIYNQDERIHKIMDQITNGYFGVPSSEFKNIYQHLMEQNDEYFVFKDFDSYVKAQERIDTIYRDRSKWMEISGINIAKSGIFSSDNTIDKYSKKTMEY